VLQRTKGGMATFDVHLVQPDGSIFTVEMLPHEFLEQWRSKYGEKVVDMGADPVSAGSVQRALLRAHDSEEGSMSASSSEEEEAYEASDEQYSSTSESDIGMPTSSESEPEEEEDDESDIESFCSAADSE